MKCRGGGGRQAALVVGVFWTIAVSSSSALDHSPSHSRTTPAPNPTPTVSPTTFTIDVSTSAAWAASTSTAAPVAAAGASTTAMLTRVAVECEGVRQCVNNTMCDDCITFVNSSGGFPHSLSEYYSLDYPEIRSYHVRFFKALISRSSCSTNSTPPVILSSALEELSDVGTALHTCVRNYGIYTMGACLTSHYNCFVDPECRSCLAALYGIGGGTKADANNSQACAATNPALFLDMGHICVTFPACTFFKQQCSSSPNCTRCLSTLDNGDGAEAARLCAGPGADSLRPSAIMDGVASFCFYSEQPACSFWRQRCADNINCSSCLAVMGNSGSADDQAADWSTLACQKAR
jgi:hypothetical protein